MACSKTGMNACVLRVQSNLQLSLTIGQRNQGTKKDSYGLTVCHNQKYTKMFDEV